MSVGDNVSYAWWPEMFRVTVFVIDEKNGGFADRGMYPLETPTIDNNHNWRWLLDQMVTLGLITEYQSQNCQPSTYSGRAISLTDNASGRVFMLLMPA